jgi:hypothetical protein
MTHRAIILISFVYTSLSFSQGYYPLQVGNQWDYGEINPQTPGQYQYLYSDRIVGDTTMSNGKTYFVLQEGSNKQFLRQSGSIAYSYISNRDSVLYDFTLQQGDTALYLQNGSYYTLITVSVGQGQILGRSLKTWSFVKTTNTSTDGGSVVTIADSLGRTYLFVDGGYDEYLMGAIIQGIKYGTVTQVNPQKEIYPTEFRLFQNYPNPFNPTTTIEYSVPVLSEVELALYSLLGKKIVVLYHGIQEPGTHLARLDASKLASGTYFVRLLAPNVSISRSIILIK